MSTENAITWFITGASRGFGDVWTRAALRRGDRVVATARDVSTLKPLADEFGDAVLPLPLDVTDRDAAFAAVARGAERFGGIDVVVNNAGYGLFGAVEEVTEAQARAQLETNLLGALWVTQAALPGMRERGRGHFLQVSSIGGVAAFPMLGLYNASKWGLEAFSESLAQEVAPHGIKVTIIEPGPYGTDWSGSSAVHAEPHPAYEQVRQARRPPRRAGRRSTPRSRPRRSSRSWTRNGPRCACSWGATACRSPSGSIPNAWTPGGSGAPSPSPPTGERAAVPRLSGPAGENIGRVAERGLTKRRSYAEVAMKVSLRSGSAGLIGSSSQMRLRLVIKARFRPTPDCARMTSEDDVRGVLG